MLTGSCLCGSVKYQYDGEIEEISHCHCSQCRKAQGSAFASVAPILSAQFSLTEGQSFIKEFRSTPNKVRAFCRECGSPLYSAKDELPEIKRLRIGTLDSEVHCTHSYHIYADSKASWYQIPEDDVQYSTKP